MKETTNTQLNHPAGVPKPMEKNTLMNCALGAVGLVIAVGACTYVSGCVDQEPLQGDVMTSELNWSTPIPDWDSLWRS